MDSIPSDVKCYLDERFDLSSELRTYHGYLDDDLDDKYKSRYSRMVDYIEFEISKLDEEIAALYNEWGIPGYILRYMKWMDEYASNDGN